MWPKLPSPIRCTLGKIEKTFREVQPQTTFAPVLQARRQWGAMELRGVVSTRDIPTDTLHLEVHSLPHRPSTRRGAALKDTAAACPQAPRNIYDSQIICPLLLCPCMYVPVFPLPPLLHENAPRPLLLHISQSPRETERGDAEPDSNQRFPAAVCDGGWSVVPCKNGNSMTKASTLH